MVCSSSVCPSKSVVTYPDVFIVAAEPSADQLGADLARALLEKEPHLVLNGIGGDRMAEAGLRSLMSIDGLAILGFVEGLQSYGLVLKKVREATRIILEHNPRAVVLIDSWGFMVRVAKRLKAQGYQGKVVKYIAPQVWATRPGRAKILARHVDHLLSTQSLDAPYFEQTDLPMTFVGNPVLESVTQTSSKEKTQFINEFGLDPSKPVYGVFLGSRPSEIERIGPGIKKVIEAISKKHPSAQPVCIVAEAVKPQVETLMAGSGVMLVPQSSRDVAMSTLDAAIACSGTITTQLASLGVPTVVVYRLSPITYFAAKRLFQQRYVSLVNISVDLNTPGGSEFLMPEFLQNEALSQAPADVLSNYLQGGEGVQALRERLKEETRRMGVGSENASDRAADTILGLIGEEKPIGSP